MANFFALSVLPEIDRHSMHSSHNSIFSNKAHAVITDPSSISFQAKIYKVKHRNYINRFQLINIRIIQAKQIHNSFRNLRFSIIKLFNKHF